MPSKAQSSVYVAETSQQIGPNSRESPDLLDFSSATVPAFRGCKKGRS
jgi:hypothetical protein